MTLPALAPALSAAVALLLRIAGERLDRPAARAGAGAAGLLAGCALLQARAAAPPGLLVLAAVASLAAAVAVTSAKPRPRRGQVRGRLPEATLWQGAMALFGGWWLAGGGVPRLPMLAGIAAILVCLLLAADLWAVGAAALCLAAALLAVGATSAKAAIALVIAASCLGGGLLLPLSAGLGGAVVLVLGPALRGEAHGVPMALATLAPAICLLLMVWWRHRFVRFGRAAAPMRAGVAAGLACLLTFSAAAMEGLR